MRGELSTLKSRPTGHVVEAGRPSARHARRWEAARGRTLPVGRRFVLYFLSEKEFAMSLFLPILLLGFAQAADQPANPAATGQALTENTQAALLNPPKFSFPYLPPKNNVVVRSEGQAVPRGRIVLRDLRDDESNLCFTMRTYLFKQRDGFAPEPVGVTTCQPASARRQKRVMGKARLVPAN